MNKITVSFKNTTRDVKLYIHIKGQEEKSEFIKKAVEHYIIYLEEENKNV